MTVVSPNVGAGSLFTQQGIGTTPGYSAIDLRRSENAALQEGVVESGAYMVHQRTAGANMQVEIDANAGSAKVQGDSVAGQGLYTVAPHATTILETILAAEGNPRVDQVILEILDTQYDGTGSSLAQTRVIKGTATAGATLANRNGAPALPGNCLLLADVLVGAAVGSISNTVIRDRRKFARGFIYRVVTSSSQVIGVSGSVVANASFRAEIASGTLFWRWVAQVQENTAVTEVLPLGIRRDGVTVDSEQIKATNSGYLSTWDGVMVGISQGSHLIEGFGSSFSGSTVASGAVLMVWEDLRTLAANNTVTSG